MNSHLTDATFIFVADSHHNHFISSSQFSNVCVKPSFSNIFFDFLLPFQSASQKKSIISRYRLLLDQQTIASEKWKLEWRYISSCKLNGFLHLPLVALLWISIIWVVLGWAVEMGLCWTTMQCMNIVLCSQTSSLFAHLKKKKIPQIPDCKLKKMETHNRHLFICDW